MPYFEPAAGAFVKASASGIAEGNYSLTGFKNKVAIQSIRIVTTSLGWSLTLYEKDDYATSPCVVVGTNLGSGNATIGIPIMYQDQDGTNELHYNFNDGYGSATHAIEVRGWELK